MKVIKTEDDTLWNLNLHSQE